MSACEELEIPEVEVRGALGGEGRSAAAPSWAGVVSLSLGIFAIVMSEFLPASLLPVIADDLRVSEGTAGQAVSVTAFAGAVVGSAHLSGAAAR